MKCQKCTKQATLHITEIVSEDQFEELHLCEECANKHLYEPQGKGLGKGSDSGPAEESEEMAALNQRQCPMCGIKFVEFRNSGRLGCPNDYQEFKDELTALLENIHGETKHVGKSPRRRDPAALAEQAEVIELRRRLREAVQAEAYEEAARLRDLLRLKDNPG